MATIDGQAGMNRMLASKTNTPGTCLNHVYRMYGSLSSIGAGAGNYPTAMAGWNHAGQKRSGDAPAGAPVYFGVSPTRTDSLRAAGDVGISVGGGRAVFTDSSAGTGRVGIMTIAARAAQIKRPYLGWTADFMGHTLVNLGAATAPGSSTGGASGNRYFPTIAALKAVMGGYIAIGYSLEVDGLDGPKFKAVVRDFQTKQGLKPDGIHGPSTELKLIAAQPKPAAPSAPAPAPAGKGTAAFGRVDVVQRALKTKYPLYAGKLVVDNVDGPGTKAAVTEFQRRSGLTPDGVAGPATRKKLGV